MYMSTKKVFINFQLSFASVARNLNNRIISVSYYASPLMFEVIFVPLNCVLKHANHATTIIDSVFFQLA